LGTTSPVPPVAAPPGAATGAGPQRRPLAGRLADRLYLFVIAAAAFGTLAGVGYLVWKMAAESSAAWETFGVWGFLTGTEWIPVPAVGDAVFGALPFIYGTAVTSLIAMIVAVPLAVGVALATTVFLPRWLRGPVAVVVDLLAAVPSVVFGLWGVVVLVPATKPLFEWIADHAGPVGLLAGPVTSSSYLLSGLVLAIMVLPIVAALSREVLLTVPPEQREAAFALGATRWEMVRRSMLPWARSGIVGASVLGLGRAVGETIALALLLGDSPNIFGSLLGPGSTLASAIAVQFGSATELQMAALTGLAVVLLAMTLLVNVVARMLIRRGSGVSGPLARAREARRGRRMARRAAGDRVRVPAPAIVDGLPVLSRGRRLRSGLGLGTVFVCLALAITPLVLVLKELIVEGGPAISVSFFTELPPADPFTPGGGISSALVGTLTMMGLSTAFSAPLGVLTALFLHDAAGRGPVMRRVGTAVGFLVDVLLGIPSIVVGLMVYLGVVLWMGHFSALAGGIALAVIMFPIVVRATDEILRLVPSGQVEAATALGAPRWRTVWSVIVPAAAPGILTGVMLALARAAGETAPLLFTSNGWQFFSTDVMEPIAALPQLIFRNMIEVQTPESLRLAWGAALVLVAIIFALNILARLVASRSRRLESR